MKQLKMFIVIGTTRLNGPFSTLDQAYISHRGL